MIRSLVDTSRLQASTAIHAKKEIIYDLVDQLESLHDELDALAIDIYLTFGPDNGSSETILIIICASVGCIVCTCTFFLCKSALKRRNAKKSVALQA